MAPSFSLDEEADGGTTNAIFHRQTFLGFSVCDTAANQRNLFLGEHMLGDSFSNSPPFWMPPKMVLISAWRTTLARLVLSIVGMCTKEQVRWSDAGRVVAVMKDIPSVRNLANIQLPRNTMSQPVSGPLRATSNQPVSAWQTWTVPQPTSVTGDNALPESDAQRYGLPARLHRSK
jgi:hypothetical protein